MKKLYAFVTAVCLLFASTSNAETRLTVALDWQHIPRTDPNMTVQMVAPIPSGVILFRRYEDGTQEVSIIDKSGVICGALTSKNSMLFLKCGAQNGFYWFSKAPKKNGQLEWIQADPPPSGTEESDKPIIKS